MRGSLYLHALARVQETHSLRHANDSNVSEHALASRLRFLERFLDWCSVIESVWLCYHSVVTAAVNGDSP